jgi:hypothetical protein
MSTPENTIGDEVEIAHLDTVISGAEFQIQQQREVIANLHSNGEPLDDAERTLEVMIAILQRLRRYRTVVKRLSRPTLH